MRREALRAAALAACAAFVVGAPSGAEAGEIEQSGWWARLQTGQLAQLPPPPGVDEGELFVQGSLDGASAVAAVRYALDESETAPVLQLRFADEGAAEAAAAAVVLACPASTEWRPGANQPWDGKPIPECSRQAIGEVSEDGASMVFDLSSFVVGATVDVVILSGKVEGLPAGADGSTFALTFAAPTEADLVTQQAGAPIETPPATATAPAPQPAGSTGAPSPVPASSGRSGSGAAPRPVTPSFQPPATPAAPALPDSEIAAPAGSAAASPAAAFDTDPVDRGDAKTLAVVLLLGAAAAAVAASRRGALVQLLGGVPAEAAPAMAGIGRFARQREGAPPTLR